MKKHNKILIPTLLTGTMFLALALVNVNSKEVSVSAKSLTAKRENPDAEEIYAPMASYQFDDESNPGKDSMGNYHLTAVGSAVSAADGVATFGGGSALYSSEVMNALGNEDFTVKATVTMTGIETYAIQMFTDYWCNGKGVGVSNWGGNLRAGLDDGENRFGIDHCWSLVLDESSAIEHTVVLSVDVGGKANYYCDGALVGTADCGDGFTLAGSPLPFALGGAVWGGGVQGFGMTGTLKDVRIYKTAVNSVGAHSLFTYNELFKADVGEQKAITPMASYQFDDESNPGKDSMGNYHLTNAGDPVTVTSGVASFAGNSALTNNDLFGAIGSNDFTIKATMTMSGAETYAIGGYKSWWSAGYGFGITNQDGRLRASLCDGLADDAAGIERHFVFGSNPDWGEVVAEDASTEHTVILSVKVGGNANLYCDGALVSSGVVDSNFNLAAADVPFALGARSWSGNVYGGLNGTMKDVRIYDRNLAIREVSELFALGDAYESSTTTVASVEELDFSSTIVVPADATEEEIIKGYAPVGKQDINVTMDNGATKAAKVVWEHVEERGGEKYLKGTLLDVLNTNEVYAYAKIAVDGEAVEMLPIAKYNFSSVDTMLEDAMGNYDLTVDPKSIYEDGVYQGKMEPNLAVEDGAVVFDGSYSLTNSKIAKDLHGTGTISFDIELPGNAPEWESPFSFGRDNWSPSQWNIFEVQKGTTILRYGACTEIDEFTGHSNIDFENKGESNSDWYPPIGELGTTKHNVTLTAGDENHLKVYLDNNLMYNHELPENFTFEVPSGAFCIGGSEPLGLQFVGKISSFAVYDFAANAQQVRVLNAAKSIKSNVVNEPYITGYGEVSYEGESILTAPVKASDDTAVMLSALKDATVTATMSDSTTEQLAVDWTRIKIEGGKYYAIGRVDTHGMLKTVAPEEVKVEFDVVNPFEITVGEVTNGTVTVDKEEAYAGETVTVTVTPAEGYEIDKVIVNDEELTAVDGVYSFVVEGDSTVKAIFKKTTPVGPVNPDEPDPVEPTKPDEKKGCKGSVVATSALISLISVAGVAVIAGKKKQK